MKTKNSKFEALKLVFDRQAETTTLEVEFITDHKTHKSPAISVTGTAGELITAEHFNPPGFEEVRSEINRLAAALAAGTADHIALTRSNMNNVLVSYSLPSAPTKIFNYMYNPPKNDWGHAYSDKPPEDFKSEVLPLLKEIFNKMFLRKELEEKIRLTKAPETNPLITAVKEANWTEVARLAEEGEDPNIIAGKACIVPLLDALDNGAPEKTVHALLAGGAAFNIYAPNLGYSNYAGGGAYLYQAIKSNYSSPTIELMLARKARPHYYEAYIDNSLIMAAYTGRRFDVITALLKAGLDVEKNVYGGTNPVSSPVFYRLISESEYNQEKDFAKLYELLLAHGADPNMCPEGTGIKRTVLHAAAQRGSPELVKTLIKAGAAVNAQDFYGDTPLHVSFDARTQGRPAQKSIDEVLLNHGANPYLKNYPPGEKPQSFLDLFNNYSITREQAIAEYKIKPEAEYSAPKESRARTSERG